MGFLMVKRVNGSKNAIASKERNHELLLLFKITGAISFKRFQTVSNCAPSLLVEFTEHCNDFQMSPLSDQLLFDLFTVMQENIKNNVQRNPKGAGKKLF